MNELTKKTVKAIFDMTAEPKLDVRMTAFEAQIKVSSKSIERSSFAIAACLYGIKKCFDYYHRVTRDNKTYDDIYEYAEDLFGFKKTSTKNAINVIETYFEPDGTLKPRFWGFGYSQLVELLPFKAEIPEEVTADTTIKEVRELKKGQTSDQKPYVSDRYLITDSKTFYIYTAEEIGFKAPQNMRIKTVLDTVYTENRTFNTFVLECGQYAAVEVMNSENAARAHQQELADKYNRLTVDDYTDVVPADEDNEDLDDEDVAEVDGNPEYVDYDPEDDQDDETADEYPAYYTISEEKESPEIDPDFGQTSDQIAEENTTNGLDYLLENGQTSDQKPARVLHLFKNKKEREDFIKDYKPWGVWKELPELGLKFYRYQFANGAVLIVTECPEYHSWATEKWVTTARHCLILNEDYELPNSYGTGCCRAYDMSGTAPTYIVDYMTKHAKEI